jgi:hypothetical protein
MSNTNNPAGCCNFCHSFNGRSLCGCTQARALRPVTPPTLTPDDIILPGFTPEGKRIR